MGKKYTSSGSISIKKGSLTCNTLNRINVISDHNTNIKIPFFEGFVRSKKEYIFSLYSLLDKMYPIK